MIVREYDFFYVHCRIINRFYNQNKYFIIIKRLKLINPFFRLLLLTATLLAICSFFFVKQTFDIRLFDTFYVIRLPQIYWLIATSLLIYWIFYRFIPMHLFSETLTSLHIILTMLVCILIVIFHISSGQLYIKNLRINLYDVPRFQKNNFILTILLMVFGLVQCIFAVNFLWSLRLIGKQPMKKQVD